MKRLISFAAFAALACSAPSPSPEPAQTATTQPTTTQATATQATATTAPETRLSQRCTNAQLGISIAYPEGWHTNDGSVIPACTAFDAQPLDIPRDSEIPFGIAVVLTRQEGSAATSTQSTQWERVISSAPLTIGGREAVRVEVEATGEGLAEKGMRTTKYVVDTGKGQALVASTHNVTDSYERNKEVLAKMVESITFP